MHVASDHNLVDTRFAVQYVVRPQTDAYTTTAATPAGWPSASCGPGDEVQVLPSGLTTTVATIDGPDGPVAEAFPPMSVTRGVPYVHRFDRRADVRIGGGDIAQLVAVQAAADTEQHRQLARVEAAYREWARHRADVDKLRRLRDAVSECLDESLVEHH